MHPVLLCVACSTKTNGGGVGGGGINVTGGSGQTTEQLQCIIRSTANESAGLNTECGFVEGLSDVSACDADPNQVQCIMYIWLAWASNMP